MEKLNLRIGRISATIERFAFYEPSTRSYNGCRMVYVEFVHDDVDPVSGKRFFSCDAYYPKGTVSQSSYRAWLKVRAILRRAGASGLDLERAKAFVLDGALLPDPSSADSSSFAMAGSVMPSVPAVSPCPLRPKSPFHKR